MSLKIYKNTKVFIISPGKKKTGGVEGLHQLAYELRENTGIDTYIYYYPYLSQIVQEEYKDYNVSIADYIEDTSVNILIIPEIYIRHKILNNFNNIRIIIWWLSIDNYFSGVPYFKKHFFCHRFINKLGSRLLGYPVFDMNVLLQRRIKRYGYLIKKEAVIQRTCCHLVQSYYARNYLIKKAGINEDIVKELYDYLNKSFLEERYEIADKENLVVFNYKKGYSFTQRIIKNTPDIKFVPLVNMSRKQVVEVLKKAKVYIDFGHHPGKDRPPREAAILGCCIITGKKGSADYFEDVPIPEEYKFDERNKNIPYITEKIKDCINNYQIRIKDFENYRRIIKQERSKFIHQIQDLFYIT
ncbi:MAG: hypothetical protein N3D17_07350 [bacterium]|nr:hypothetical protein [bacterium]